MHPHFYIYTMHLLTKHERQHSKRGLSLKWNVLEISVKPGVHEVESGFVVIAVIHLFQAWDVLVVKEKPIKFTFHVLKTSNWYQVSLTDIQSPDIPVEGNVKFILAKNSCTTELNEFVNVPASGERRRLSLSTGDEKQEYHCHCMTSPSRLLVCPLLMLINHSIHFQVLRMSEDSKTDKALLDSR